jgi:hypothetical protein
VYTDHMSMLYKAIQSRTIWTIVLMFLIGGFQAVQSFFSPEAYIFINGILSLLAGYFRLDARA